MIEELLPGNVRRLEVPGGVRYVLPRRPSLGGMLFIPLFLGTIFTVVGTLITVFFQDGSSEGREWSIPVIMGVVFAFCGVLLLRIGVFLTFGHIEIELAGNRLSVISRAGFLRWTRSRPSRGLNVITALHTPGSSEDGTVMSGPAAEVALLRATWEGGSTMTLAGTYPIGWLTGIARDLTARLGPGAVMEQVGPASYSASAASTDRRPAGSNAILHPLPEGLSLTLPPRGLRRGSSGYLSFGLLWIAMNVGLNVFAYFLIRRGPFPGSYIFVTVFMVLLSGVGWAMLGAGIHLGRRKATFEVAGGLLTFSTAGPFGKKRHQWSLTEIIRIHVGPSGRTTNHIPHMALSIHGRGRDPILALEERDPVELRWIAGVLSAEVARARSK